MIPWIPKKEIHWQDVQEFLQDSIQSNHFTNNGPGIGKLSALVRNLLQIDASKCILPITNGALAIHAAVSAIELKEGRKLRWATQSFTFPPSAQGPLGGADIVDIDEEGGLDLSLVKEDIDGIIVTNIFGSCVDVEKYEAWAKTNKKYLLFDNAATPFTFFKGVNSCNFGHGSIISFHHTKPLGFGEGGAVILDVEFEPFVKRIVNFGIDNAAEKPEWHSYGSNYKMSDIAAAFIYQFLKNNFSHTVYNQSLLLEHLKKKLQEFPMIQLYPSSSEADPFYSCLPLLLPQSEKVMERFVKEGVFCRKYYTPLCGTPIAMKIYRDILCFPFHTDMNIDDLDKIFNRIKEILFQ